MKGETWVWIREVHGCNINYSAATSLPRPHPLPRKPHRRLPKRLQNPPAQPIPLPVILRVPLHPERKPSRALNPHRLHRPIRRPALRHQPWRQLQHPLVVQRVHRNHIPVPRQPRQQRPRRQLHVMRLGRPAERNMLVARRRVIHPPRQVLDALVQTPAQRHVQLLHPTADRQDRHAMLDGGADQRQHRRVPHPIFKS